MMCAAGQYSSAIGASADVCVSCPINSMSEPGSGSIADCRCNAGYSGTGGNCAACPPGTYKEDRGAEPCVLCPNSTYWVGNGAGTSKEDVCQPCPALSESPPGSFSEGNCTCIAGSEQGEDGSCKFCPSGKFKGRGERMCENCPAGSWNAEGSNHILQCQCGQGYYGPDGEE